jgi:hypothetical protein
MYGAVKPLPHPTQPEFVPFPVSLTMPDHLIHPETGN